MKQLGASAIHPPAPEFLSAAVLANGALDLDAAIARLNSRWRVGAVPQWADMPASDTPTAPPAGQLLHFAVQGVTVMLSSVAEPLTPEKGKLPAHTHYVAITLYSKVSAADTVSDAAGAGAGAGSAAAGTDTPELPDERAAREAREADAPAIARRRAALTAHILLTQLADVLLAQSAAIGLYRAELGVVQPPAMLAELAPLLRQGQVPLPLWVNIRLQPEDSGLMVGRTLGMPLFGHLDLEILDSPHPADEVYAELAATASYLITGDSYLIPGQTVGRQADEQFAVTEELSELDHTPVIRIMYN